MKFVPHKVERMYIRVLSCSGFDLRSVESRDISENIQFSTKREVLPSLDWEPRRFAYLGDMVTLEDSACRPENLTITV